MRARVERGSSDGLAAGGVGVGVGDRCENVGGGEKMHDD